jgi:hypothetical protein
MTLVKSNIVGIGTSTLGVSNATGAVFESQYNPSTGAFSFWLDRAAAGTGTNVQTFSAATTQIGINGGTQAPFDGSMGELISYDLVGGIPSGSRTTIETNQKAYWGTP